MPDIDATRLQHWIDQRRDFALVDTLPPAAFQKAHLPTAINIISDDIVARAPSELPDRTRPVVVYCASVDCKRAPRSAKRLERLGYQSVYEFVGGKREWRDAGLPMVGTEHAHGD